MKKVLTTLFLSLFLLPPALAQDYPDSLYVTQEVPYTIEEFPPVEYQVPSFPKNELDFSLTLGTGLQLIGVFAGVAATVVGSIAGSLSGEYDSYIAIPIIIPSPAIEYNRWINDSFAVGGIFNTDIVSFLPYMLVSNISLMPEVKYRWLNKERVKLYSKLAAGILGTLVVEQKNEEEGGGYSVYFAHRTSFNGMFSDSTSPLLKSYLIPPIGFQLSPIGIDLTTAVDNLDFFMELGVGSQGIFTFGLKKAF